VGGGCGYLRGGGLDCGCVCDGYYAACLSYLCRAGGKEEHVRHSPVRKGKKESITYFQAGVKLHVCLISRMPLFEHGAGSDWRPSSKAPA